MDAHLVKEVVHENISTKKRLEYIDLAKGVCITLVIIGHTGLSITIPGLDAVRMPLYFILSGLFFKDYGGLGHLFKKKFNKILFPFLFFYLTAYVVFYTVEYLLPGFMTTGARGIADIWTQRQYFNGPIWFLLALFWANIMFCIISQLINNLYFQGLIVIIIGCFGAYLGLKFVFLPFMIDSAMTALPFFWFGYVLKKTPILYPNRYDRFNVLISFALYGLVVLSYYVLGNNYVGFHNNNVCGNYPFILVISTLGVISILLLCKSIKTLPFLTFFGRYSIIPLCTHHLVYRPLALVIDRDTLWGELSVALLTLAICAALIPLFRRFLPWAVAQKDIWK